MQNRLVRGSCFEFCFFPGLLNESCLACLVVVERLFLLQEQGCDFIALLLCVVDASFLS